MGEDFVFPPGLRFRVDGREVTVGQKIGGGGQGIVQRVDDAAGAPVYALKSYPLDAVPQEMPRLIRELIARGNPDRKRFVWPLKMLKSGDERRQGYLMPLVPPSYRPVSDLLADDEDDLRRPDVLTRVGLEIAHGVLLLHVKGLCYRDINSDNLLFDPATGHIAICDNDNVGVDNGLYPSSLTGTPFFIAPETLTTGAQPSRRTDLHAVAVLLFWLLIRAHPLRGRRVTRSNFQPRPGYDRRLYGEHALFVFDPTDASNRPDPQVDPRAGKLWSRCPTFLRRLFIRAFTDGLTDPRQRVSLLEWCDALIRLRDVTVSCAACEELVFLDPDVESVPCRCGGQVTWDLRVDIRGHHLPVSPRARIVSHHVTHNLDVDEVVARTEMSPLRLRNVSDSGWSVSWPDGHRAKVAPQASVELSAGMTVRISSGQSSAVATVGTGAPASRDTTADAAGMVMGMDTTTWQDEHTGSPS